ncbi:Coenzyme F420 hydrogenase/dehydrogenase, beta subunit C-terminal domain [Phocaeicola sp.]
MPKLASEKYCTGCLACIDVCKHDAIRIVLKNELTYVTINANKCINCGLCEKSCPIITPIKKNQVKNMIVYGGWATEDEIRIKAASGGAFAALAQNFFHLYDKAVVVGASLSNNRVNHIIIERIEEIELLMNSKYIQSNTQGIYHAVAQKLKEGYHILFSGTPCQIAGLYGYLGRKRTNAIYTVELVCHGIPGNEALDLHLKYYHSPKIYTFRDKKDGQYWYASQCTTIDLDGKATKLNRSNDIFYQIFSGWMLDRKSCSNCQYSSIERVADITIADFWGGPFKNEEFKKGVSLIIANNNHAIELITQNSYLHITKTGLKPALSGNSNLYNGFKYIQYHPIVMFSDFFRKHLPNNIRLAILTNKKPWKLLWAIFKILTKIHARNVRKDIAKKYKI